MKFWKKQEIGIEFVKHYRGHLGVVTAVSTSADGGMFASAGSDKTLKVFDVVNFDLINMIKLDYIPRAICWIHRKGRAEVTLAVAEEDSTMIRLYDGRGTGEPIAEIASVHRKPVHLLSYLEPLNCIISADEGGMVEYWSPEEPYEKPSSSSHAGLWEFKASTDLFDFKKKKSVPTSLNFSPDYKRFVTHSLPDRTLRVFDSFSGKILSRYSEDLTTIQELQTAGTSGARLDEMEFGRRLAQEKQLDKQATEPGAVNASQGLRTMNAVFNETGHFIVYPTMLGIKIVNTYTEEMSVLLGKDETVRYLNVSLFQGIGGNQKKSIKSLALMASDNPAAASPSANGGLGDQDVQDPTLFCTGHRKERFYLFTRLEPDHNPRSKGGSERDVFNEKPSREEQTIASGALPGGTSGSSSLSKASRQSNTSAILHTTLGDIHLKLFPSQVPKTVENFVGLAKKGYYNQVIFHRVIARFMLQTGDPLGDGTGGESLWGSHFEDEIVKELKHDQPYTLSMANAGPGTNGSQFFITTVPTPWLDGKHTIFGRCTSGMDVVHRIERCKVDGNDKPREEIRILNITLS